MNLRGYRWSGLLPDIIAGLVASVLGDLLDWWNWPDLSAQGGVFVVLVMIWVRLALRG